MTSLPRPHRGRRPAVDSHINRERWLVSYADFITLLFAFFTTMYAISTVDNQKLSDMVESMQTAFDAKKFDPSKMPPPKNTPRATNVPPLDHPGELEELKKRLSQRLESQITGGQVGLEVDPRGLVITIREAGVFQIGSADLSPAARAVLREVADAMQDVQNPVRVEGHTDDVPIHTSRFSSNWELSTARATTVIAFFVQERGLSPTRFSAAGYAEFHPRVASNSADARAQNRRVDIVILNEQTRKAEEPAVAVALPKGALPEDIPTLPPPAPPPAPAVAP
jgi:chemotaxis protein MotB